MTTISTMWRLEKAGLIGKSYRRYANLVDLATVLGLQSLEAGGEGALHTFHESCIKRVFQLAIEPDMPTASQKYPMSYSTDQE